MDVCAQTVNGTVERTMACVGEQYVEEPCCNWGRREADEEERVERHLFHVVVQCYLN